MSFRFRDVPSVLLNQVPTVLSLTVLGLVAWWGYAWEWKIPSLPDLLHPSAKKSDELPKEAEAKKESEDPDKPLPPIVLASEEKMKAAGIGMGTVDERLIDEHVKANGDINFDQDHYAHLSTRANGTAWSVHKHHGDEVKKGDVLALIAAPSVAQLKFDLQQRLLAVQTRDKYLQRLKSAAPSTYSAQVIESAESSLREARIALSNDEQSLQNLGLSIRTAELSSISDEQVTAHLRTLGIPDTLVQRLDAETLTNNLLPMVAPFDSVVIKRDIVIGEVVNPGMPQFVLADLRRLWIMLHVRLEDASKLAIGQDVAFHLDGPNEDAPPAKTTWISAEVDEKTRTVLVRAEVENIKGRLRPGTFGSARILVHREKRLIVPNGALQFDGTSHFIFARGKSATEFHPLRVRLGMRHDDFTEIRSGAKAGQKIAIAGSHALLSEMLKERIEGDE